MALAGTTTVYAEDQYTIGIEQFGQQLDFEITAERDFWRGLKKKE